MAGTNNTLSISVDSDVLLPALAVLALLLAAIAYLYLTARAKRVKVLQLGDVNGGTAFVSDSAGHVVRRTLRERRGPARWSPDDLSTPTGFRNGVKTPTAEKGETHSPAKTPIVASVATGAGESTPGAMRGRVPKVPKSDLGSATPSSPAGLRRSGRTPKLKI